MATEICQTAFQKYKTDAGGMSFLREDERHAGKLKELQILPAEKVTEPIVF